jgi:hypothetical protein
MQFLIKAYWQIFLTQIKYPNQNILVVEIDGYTHCVPYVENGNTIFMKTIFPSRKFMKLLENK